MTEFTISNLRSIYITNEPYRYPNPWLKKGTTTGKFFTGDFLSVINTGWHILPNLLWGHLANPQQWWDMVVRFEAISVRAIKTRLFNPIPIQTALAFQGNNTFPAFNNTVYAMTYTDDLYETPWFNWRTRTYPGKINQFYEWNPAYKEGLIPKPRTEKYDYPNDTATDKEQLISRPDLYPKSYCTLETQGLPQSYQKDEYRRQQLPIYWYTMPFPQYGKKENLEGGWAGLLSYFEEAFIDPSGTFWDPLNRPDSIGELRPGKNMIEYRWEAHSSDSHIWFNTDRIALIPPYIRPRPIQVPSGNINITDVPPVCNPTTPGRKIERYEWLVSQGLLTPGEDRTVPEEEMAPETMSGLPNWRDFPVVPMRWFMKEVQQSNPWVYQDLDKIYYHETPDNCPQPRQHDAEISGERKGDVEIQGPIENLRFVGTEYEMYKYPPTQWFIKGVPLYDDRENHIPVEMQMFMHTTVTILGKPRKSALYAPSWGPINNQDLYSINMDTGFGENYIRGRSAGARRTWYDPEGPRAYSVPYLDDIWLYEKDGGGKDKFPKHPKKQCTIHPNAEATATLAWPRVAWYMQKDVNVRIETKIDNGHVGKRNVQYIAKIDQ